MDKSNGGISKILSTMWKEADEEIKLKYRSEEAALWKKYKIVMEEWRKKEGPIKQDKGERRKMVAKAEEITGNPPPPAPEKREVDSVSLSNHVASNLNHASILPTVSGLHGVDAGALALASMNRNPSAASAYAALLHGGIDPYGLNLGLSGSLLGPQLGYSDYLNPTPNLAMLSALSRPPLGSLPYERFHPLLSTQVLYGLQDTLLSSPAHQLSLSRMAALLAAERRAAGQGSDEGNAKTPKSNS